MAPALLSREMAAPSPEAAAPDSSLLASFEGQEVVLHGAQTRSMLVRLGTLGSQSDDSLPACGIGQLSSVFGVVIGESEGIVSPIASCGESTEELRLGCQPPSCSTAIERGSVSC